MGKRSKAAVRLATGLAAGAVLGVAYSFVSRALGST